MTNVPEIKTLAATNSWGRGRVYENITETIGHTPSSASARSPNRPARGPTF